MAAGSHLTDLLQGGTLKTSLLSAQHWNNDICDVNCIFWELSETISRKSLSKVVMLHHSRFQESDERMDKSQPVNDKGFQAA